MKADLVMIADSTGGWTAAKAADYAHDIEVLAKAGYLKWVDVTLLSNGVEVKAVALRGRHRRRSGLPRADLAGFSGRKCRVPHLRIVLSYTDAYTSEMRGGHEEASSRSVGSTSYDDTSHVSLMSSGGRNYASNAYGMQRKDWAA